MKAKKDEELTVNLVVDNQSKRMIGNGIFGFGVQNKALRG
jgi:hypothetical protein